MVGVERSGISGSFPRMLLIGMTSKEYLVFVQVYNLLKLFLCSSSDSVHKHTQQTVKYKVYSIKHTAYIFQENFERMHNS